MVEHKIQIPMVINTCYGGFGLSFAAQEEIAKRKGLDYRIENATVRGQYVVYGEFELISDLPRTDPDMVAVVRKLGTAANGDSAELKVVDVSIEIEVLSYDGKEKVRVHGGDY